MQRRNAILIAAGAVLLLALAWLAWHRSIAATKDGAGQAPAAGQSPEPVALVRTQPVSRRELPIVVAGLGDVITGQIDAISFPRAGQVSRLLVTPGQRVTKGTPLATLASDPNVQTTYQQALNAVGFAQRELNRTEELYGLQLATRSQLDGARRALKDAQANLSAQRKLGGGVVSDDLRAPFDGIVTAIPVSLGDRLQAGAPILQLGHTDALRVQLGLEPAEAPQVRKGMPVTITPLQDRTRALTGTVAVVQQVLDPKSQLFNVIVVLPPGAVRDVVPGMRVRGSIVTGHQEGWAVPRQAVLSDDQGSYIYQVAGGKARRVQVKQLRESDQLVTVDGPIQANQPLVVLGNYELQDGMKVREDAQ